jgi:hypothetical protein
MTRTSPPLLVLQTYFCPSRADRRMYEIHLGEINARQPLRLVTTDSVAYQAAVDAEGTWRRCVATWHLEGRTAVLDELEVRR